MNLIPQIKPVEQLIAIGATGLAIRAAAKGNAAKFVSAANTALAVGAAFTTASSGNAAGAVNQIESLLSDPTMDPTVALSLQGLFGIAENLIQFQANANVAIPVIGSAAEGILANIGTGITSIAQAYIAKYTPLATAAASAPVSTVASVAVAK